MNIIVTADDNWAIGYKNKPLVAIPSDANYFRKTTAGKVLVMGRKTLENYPGQRPLPMRTNIVLTSREGYRAKDALTVHSIDELNDLLKDYKSEDVYVIGGDSLYRQLLPFCDLVHVTKVHHTYQADCWFPDLDRSDEWEITDTSDEQTYFDLTYHFVTYERK